MSERLEKIPENTAIEYKNEKGLSLKEICELLGLKPGPVYVYKHRKFGREKVPIGKILQCYYNDYYENHYPNLKDACNERGWDLQNLASFKARYLEPDTTNRELISTYARYLRSKEIVAFGKSYKSLAAACRDLNVSYGCFTYWLQRYKGDQKVNRGELLEEYVQEKKILGKHRRASLEKLMKNQSSELVQQSIAIDNERI